MAKIKFFIDPIGNTFSLWYKDPKEEDVCEQSELGDILSLDKKGNIIGFEKINFFPQEFIDVFNKLPRKDYEGRLLAVEKRQKNSRRLLYNVLWQKKYKQLTKDTDFAEYLKKQLKNPSIKKAYDEEGARLKIAYELNKLRAKQGLTGASIGAQIKHHSKRYSPHGTRQAKLYP